MRFILERLLLRKSGNQSIYAGLYPDSVRYAIKHRDGLMGKDEIESLIKSNYIHEAIYLITKSLKSEKTQMEIFLSELTSATVSDNPDVKITEILENWLLHLPTDTKVGGLKLGQLSRAGSEVWSDNFIQLAKSSRETKPDAVPHLVAFAAMIGYVAFVQEYFKEMHTEITNAKEIVILVPEWIVDENEPDLGFYINLESFETKVYSKNDPLFYNPHFVDDTINTGKSSGKVRGYWKQVLGVDIPEDRIFVITDLR